MFYFSYVKLNTIFFCTTICGPITGSSSSSLRLRIGVLDSFLCDFVVVVYSFV